MSKEKILEKRLGNYAYRFGGSTTVDIFSSMDEYAKEEMVRLIENISRQPVEVYSQKVKGQDKQFFLGRTYVEDLINRIKKAT